MHRRHRQERWLHTRISANLEEALKREARRRRTPVSLLVRNVLEGALDLVEEIVEDGLDLADPGRLARRFVRAARGADAAPEADDLSEVYGWQEIVLNQAARCARCDAALGAGTGAHRGLSERPARPLFLCARCLRRLRRPAERERANDRREEEAR